MNYEYQFSDKIGLPWVIEKMPQYLFPDLAKKKKRIKKLLCGIIATKEKKPVGLVLGSFDQAGTSVRIHSMMVHPEHRGKGIATEMLNALELSVAQKGAKAIDGHFRSHWKSVKAIERLLRSRDWTAPQEALVLVRGEASRVLSLFMDDRLSLDPGYSFITHSELTPQHRDQIQSIRRNAKLDQYLDPFIQEETILSAASIFLLHESRVVGWVIAHLIATDLSEYTALFIHSDHRSYKHAHLLMRKAIYQQHSNNVKHFLITAKHNNSIMIKFLLRHAEDTGVFLTRSMQSSKALSS